MTEEEELNVKIVSKREAYWTDLKTKFETTLEANKNETMFLEKAIKLCEDEIKNENK